MEQPSATHPYFWTNLPRTWATLSSFGCNLPGPGVIVPKTCQHFRPRNVVISWTSDCSSWRTSFRNSDCRNVITRLLQEPFYAPIVASLNDDMTTRNSKSSCAYPIIGSRRFNRNMAMLVNAVRWSTHIGLHLVDWDHHIRPILGGKDAESDV